MNKIKILALLIILSSCTSISYLDRIISEFPENSIYRINDSEFIIVSDSNMYYIEYFKGQKFETELIKIPRL